jgi:hypothetical protein
MAPTIIDLSVSKLTAAMQAHAHEDKKLVMNCAIMMLIEQGFTRVQATMLATAAYRDVKK